MNTKSKKFTWSGLAYALVLILLVTTMVGIVAYAAGSKTHNIGGNVSFTADGVEATVVVKQFEGLEIGTTDYTPVSYTTWAAESTHTVLQDITYSTDSSTVSATTAAAKTWTELAVNITDTTSGDGTLTFTITNKASAALYTAVSVSSTTGSGVTVSLDKETATLAATGESGDSTTYTITFKVDDVNYNVTSFTFSIDVTLSTTAISGGTSASSLDVLGNSTDGYYIEMGEYPTTFAGYASSTSYTETDEKFTLADGTAYTVYTDSSDNRYIQYTANSYSTSYYYSDYTNTTTSVATWFKLEPIKWDVIGFYDTNDLDNDDDKTEVIYNFSGLDLTTDLTDEQIIVISELGLEAMEFDGSEWGWGTGTEIYDWLNTNFYSESSAFTSDERSHIATYDDTETSAPYTNIDTSTDPYVWLLSYTEASTWYTSSSERLCSPSDFALATGAYMYTSTSYTTSYRSNGGTCYWWFRSCGNFNYYAYAVDGDGPICDDGDVDFTHGVARPALLINL